MLYYLSATREAEDIKSPHSYLTFHCVMKNCQLGMLAGCAAGGLLGLLRKNFTGGTVFMDMTKCIGAAGLGGAALGFPQAGWHYSGMSFAEKQEEAFKIQKSLFHNRLDMLTVAGCAAGFAIAPTRAWMGFLEFAGAETLPRAGAFVWTTFGGFLMDVPLVLLGVLYYAHVDDIDVAGCKKEDD